MNEAYSQLLREKGYMSFVDVLIALGKLTHEDYERWRFHRISCLEQVITINLAKVNTLLRAFHENAKRGVTSVPTPRCCPLQAGERDLDRYAARRRVAPR